MADFQPLTAPTLKTDFPTAFRGYDTVKVDDWVRQMQEYLNKLIANVNNSLASIESSQNNDSQQTAALTQENERLHNQLADRDAKIEQLKTQLEQMREQADANTDGQSYMALGASAQRIIDEARRDAQNIRTKAQSDYDETMQAANKQAGHIIDDAEATRSRIANICHDNVENANKHVEVAMGAYMHMKQTLKNNLDAFENVDINQWRDLNFDPDGIVFGTSIPGAAVNQTQHTASTDSTDSTDSTANAAPVPPAPTQPQQPQQQHSEPIAASHIEPDNPPQHSLKSNATRGSNALRFGVQNRQTQETTTPPQHDGAIVGNAVHAAVNNAADPVQQQQQPQQQSVPATPSAPPAPPAQPTAQTTQTTQSTQSQTDADRTDTSDAIRDGERGYSVRISSREDDNTPDSIQRTDTVNEPVASNTDNADNTGSTDGTDNNPDPSDEYNVLNQTQGLTPNGGIA